MVFEEYEAFMNLIVCLFVTEEIPITLSWRAAEKEARTSPYHYCF